MSTNERFRHLYIAPEQWGENSINIAGDDHHYLFKVLRLKPGVSIIIFDGQGTSVHTSIESIESDSALLSFKSSPTRALKKGAKIHALISIIKGERMESTLEKLTELGVDEITPVFCKRTIVSLDEKRSAKRLLRYQKTIRAAATQSENHFMPLLNPMKSLMDATASCQAELKITMWARGGELFEPSLDTPAYSTIAFLIGPEGGLTDDELRAADSDGFRRKHLGPRVLRADSAAIATATTIGLIWGDLGSSQFDPT